MKFLVVAAAVVACAGARSINSGWVLPAGNIGTSGILRKDGSTNLFGHDFAHSIISIGPAGIILKDGPPIQLDADLNMVGRSKRSTVGFVNNVGSIGRSGIVRKDGTIEQFDSALAHDIAYFGPTGIILKNGPPIHLNENLNTMGRTKRHTVGPSGMITSWGQAIQFKEPFATIILDGPSGFQLSDGTLVQKPAQ
ncbi:cuticular protein 34 [Penaeus vannamei]|uniref:Cuticular protein 34 n=1 Tax=Penaeus vannamei TaxID=6689 RepID=A0A423TRM8_PENVA|nr:cuticle protein CP1158-like [Penaeus vannamei]ROT79112.1 cuticular protein 34 [Penaeus vannamei]